MTPLRTTSSLLVILSVLAAVSCGGGPLRVGILLPETGEFAPLGKEISRGVDLALEGVEMVAERPLEIVREDTGSQPAQAAAVFRELIEGPGLHAAVGGATAREMTAMAPVAEELERVLVSPTASGPDAAMDSEWVFSLWPTPAIESTKLSTFARSQQVKYMVVVYAQGSFGQGFKNELVPAFKNQRGEVLAVHNYAGGIAGEAAAELAIRINEQKPDGVAIVTPLGSDVVNLGHALREGGYEGKLFTTSRVGESPVLRERPGAEGIFFPLPATDWDASEEAREFAASYRAAYGGEPTVRAALGHDAVKVLLGAIEEASGYPADTLGALRRTSAFQGALGEISFNPKGRVVRALKIYTIREGELLPWEGRQDL